MAIIVKIAAIALAGTGLSHTDANFSSGIVGPTQESIGFGISFEDLRVGPTGKVATSFGRVEMPFRVAANGCSEKANSKCD